MTPKDCLPKPSDEDHPPASATASAAAEIAEEANPASRILRQLQIKSSRGPLPPAEEVQAYEAILPGAAERLFNAAEKQANHRRRCEEKLIECYLQDQAAERAERRRGQILGFSIGALSLILSAVVAYYSPWVGGLIGGTTVCGLVTAFIVGRKYDGENETENNGSDSDN